MLCCGLDGVLARTAASPLSSQSPNRKVGPSGSCWRFIPSRSSHHSILLRKANDTFSSGSELARNEQQSVFPVTFFRGGESVCPGATRVERLPLRDHHPERKTSPPPPACCPPNNVKVKNPLDSTEIEGFPPGGLK